MIGRSIAIALVLVISSGETSLAQRPPQGGAASNLTEELASCIRAVAPNLAQAGIELKFVLHENGSLADAPGFRTSGPPLSAQQMRDAIGRLRRCFPLEGVHRYRYQYRDWQTLVISFGDVTRAGPTGSPSPDHSRAATDQPQPTAEPGSGSRVVQLRCEDLQQVGRLTVASWATLSRVPLFQLTFDELQQLKLKARACARRPTVDFVAKVVLMDLESSFEGMSIELKRREAEARVAEQRRREAEAADRLVEEARTQLQTIVSAQSVRDPDEECNPKPDEVLRQFGSQIGALSGRLAMTPLWRQFSQDCEARLHRAREAARQAEQSRRETDIDTIKRRVFAHAAQAREQHRMQIDQLGLPAAFLDAPLNLRPQATITEHVVDVDLSSITVGQWIGMIMSGKPEATLAGVIDRESGLAGFSMKLPGIRTIAFFLQEDGGDVFITRFQNGDRIYQVQNFADRTVVNLIIFGQTRLANILSGQAAE